MINISHFERDQLYVVTLEGELISNSVSEVNKYLTGRIESISSDHEKEIMGIILDCDQLDFIDSTGVGLICGK